MVALSIILPKHKSHVNAGKQHLWGTAPFCATWRSWRMTSDTMNVQIQPSIMQQSIECMMVVTKESHLDSAANMLQRQVSWLSCQPGSAVHFCDPLLGCRVWRFSCWSSGSGVTTCNLSLLKCLMHVWKSYHHVCLEQLSCRVCNKHDASICCVALLSAGSALHFCDPLLGCRVWQISCSSWRTTCTFSVLKRLMRCYSLRFWLHVPCWTHIDRLTSNACNQSQDHDRPQALCFVLWMHVLWRVQCPEKRGLISIWCQGPSLFSAAVRRCSTAAMIAQQLLWLPKLKLRMCMLRVYTCRAWIVFFFCMFLMSSSERLTAEQLEHHSLQKGLNSCIYSDSCSATQDIRPLLR